MTTTSTYPLFPGFKGRETSAQAAEAIASRAPQLRTAALGIITGSAGGLTADEVAGKMKRSILSVRPRIAELARTGAIEDTGSRRKNSSGKNAIVWRARA